MVVAILDVFVGAIYGPKNENEKAQGFIGFSCMYINQIFFLITYS